MATLEELEARVQQLENVILRFDPTRFATQEELMKLTKSVSYLESAPKYTIPYTAAELEAKLKKI